MKNCDKSALKRPKASDIDFWHIFAEMYNPKQEEIEKLKVFIQAPSNGFLLFDVLRNFTQLEKDIEKGVKPYQKFKSFIGTAKWMLAEITQNFKAVDESYYHLYFDAYITKVCELNHFDLSDQTERLTKFVHGNLLHSHKKNNALYTGLFFPYVADTSLLEERPSLAMTLQVQKFIKAQSFKLLANSNIKLPDSALYEFSSGLIKIITLEQYDHLNIAGYELMDTPEKIFHAILRGHEDDEHALEDKTKQKHLKKKANKNELKANDGDEDEIASKEGIERAQKRLLRFFARFFQRKFAKTKNENTSNSSERGTYNRKMGLVVLDKIFKEKYTYTEAEMPIYRNGNNTKVRSIRHPKPAGSKSNATSDYVEYGDDIDAETDTEQLSWIQLPSCELKNPIAKLIHTKRLAPHIAFANQQLKSRLAENAVSKIMNHINDAFFDIELNGRFDYKIEKRKILLSLILTILLGRHFKSIRFDQAKIDIQTLELSEDCSKAWLKIPHYHNVFYLAHPELFQKASINLVELVMPDEVRSLLSTLVVSLQEDGMIKKGRLNLPTSQTINSYLSENIRKQLELPRLMNAVSRSYSLYSQNDSWLMGIFSGDELGLQKTQKHYASIPLRKTQRIFEKHCASFLGVKVIPYLGFNRTELRLGSPFYINRDMFGELVISLYQLSRPLIEPLKFEMTNLEEIVVRFNALAIYIDLYCAFSCAIRNVYDPSVDIDMISEEGLYRVNDKNIHDGFNTRITYVPPTLRRALEQYRLMRRKVLVALKKVGLMDGGRHKLTKQNELIYFTIENNCRIQVNRYSRMAARDAFCSKSAIYLQLEGGIEELHLLTQLKTNVNRHYLRGRLLELDVPGFYIDAYLGHWHLGTQPWGQMSLFDQKDYMAIMRQHIPNILDELGFKAFDQECFV